MSAAAIAAAAMAKRSREALELAIGSRGVKERKKKKKKTSSVL